MSNIEKFYGVSNSNEVLQALLWQYDNAEALQVIVYNQRDFLVEAETNFWCWYLFNYFRLYGADSHGVTIWSILLDYGITATSLNPNISNTWGFGNFNQNFGHGNFGSKNSRVVSLPTEWAVFALKLRYFGLVGGCTVPQINAALNWIMGYDGSNISAPHIWVRDNNDMSITYVLNFAPNQYMRYIFDYLDLLPRPAGVKVNWEVFVSPQFGFGAVRQNFEHGTFGA